jgi:SAM-dependent methyltransferase
MENPQQRHYEAIHDEYTAHYFDATSIAYRRRFLLAPLLQGIDLSHKRVAELACGSGYNSVLLKQMFPGISLEGFDISARACAEYRRAVGAPAREVDLTRPQGGDARFDAVIVLGGLHHCVADLPTAFANIAALLRPGGLLLAIEPNARFFAQAVRDRWYRADRYFDAETERALDLDELAAATGANFRLRRSYCFGGPAYFLILNSLLFRMPVGLKRYVASPLFALERLWNAIPGRIQFPAFGAVWERTPD